MSCDWLEAKVELSNEDGSGKYGLCDQACHIVDMWDEWRSEEVENATAGVVEPS